MRSRSQGQTPVLGGVGANQPPPLLSRCFETHPTSNRDYPRFLSKRLITTRTSYLSTVFSTSLHIYYLFISTVTAYSVWHWRASSTGELLIKLCRDAITVITIHTLFYPFPSVSSRRAGQLLMVFLRGEGRPNFFN